MIIYNSITTPNVQHDAANMLAEFIWLNSDINSDVFPWRGQNNKKWGKLVASLKKLMREPYGLSQEQLAFYIWHCRPANIRPQEFAKMAVVARRLFHKYDLEQVCVLYKNLRKELCSSGLEYTLYKKPKSKSLLAFLRELENEH